MDYQEEQRQEVASLKSIFPGEFAELNTFPPTFMIRIDDVDISTFVKFPFHLNIPMKSLPLKFQTVVMRYL